MVKHPSVCLSHQLTAAVATGRFAAEHPAGRRYQSIAGAGAQQQWCHRARHGACSSALSSKRLASCLQLTYEAETDLLSVFLAYISYNICKWLPVDIMCVWVCYPGGIASSTVQGTTNCFLRRFCTQAV